MTLTIYSKKDCSFCKKFKALVEFEELKHVVYELDRDFTKEEFYDKFGEGSTFPQVLLDEISLGGCVDSVKYLKEKKLCCMV